MKTTLVFESLDSGLLLLTMARDFENLQSYLSEKLDDLSGADSSGPARFEYSLKEYKDTAKLLDACGYETADLLLAIASTEEAFVNLIAVRENIVNKFNVDGLSLLLKDESEAKRKRQKGEESLHDCD